jgi:LPXTG-site transpeptidase (sortase) family protein
MHSKSNELTDKLPLISRIGLTLVVIALIITVLNYFPVVKQEVGYIARTHRSDPAALILPFDREFGIVVPKIGANSHVTADVDPFNSVIYQQALTKGVAHAKNTAKPGQRGNVFLFAHSSDSFFNANTYNSIFYLLHRIETGDKFELYYKGEKFEYEVTEKSVVDPSKVDYLEQPKDEKVATLMTCWPPGTTLKRLVIVGKQL